MAIGLAADFTRDVGCIGAKLWTEWLTRDHRPQEPLRAITRTLSNIDEPVMRPTDVSKLRRSRSLAGTLAVVVADDLPPSLLDEAGEAIDRPA